MSKQRARAWCFTIFPQEELWTETTDIMKSLGQDKAQYLIYGIEKCPTSGRRHLQGYIYFKNSKSMSAVKKLLKDNTAHLEKARGSPQENIKYCSKDGEFFFFGDEPKQGKRTDIAMIKDDLATGANMRTVILNARSNQGIQYAKSYMTYHEKKRDYAPEVFWIYGPTGTFKSTLAQQMAKDPHYQQESGKWWDGYDAHEDVIINDFTQDFCKYAELLRLLDRYPHRVQVKGGYRSWLAKRIFITCPSHPKEMFGCARQEGRELMRRINHIWYMKKVDWNKILGIEITQK